MYYKNTVFILLILITGILKAQKSEFYETGVDALNRKDTSLAENYFKYSIARNRDAESYFALANIQYNKNSFESRNLALENYHQAVLRDPSNIKYKLGYYKLKTEMWPLLGIKDFQKITPDEVTELNDIIEVANVYAGLYETYRNINFDANVDNKSQDFQFAPINMNEYAADLAATAKKYYSKAYESDPNSPGAVLGFARLTALIGNYELAIEYLNNLYKIKPDIPELNIYLGMFYYRIRKFKLSLNHFDKAFIMSKDNTRRIFEFETVLLFFPDSLKNKILKMTPENQKNYLKEFWEKKDPFLLSEENERLAEHYYRVAYSNFFFGSPRLNIPGWQTDRGKVFISFGEPDLVVKSSSKAVVAENWTYNFGKKLLFTCNMYNYYKLDWKADKVGPRWDYPSVIETSADIYDKFNKERFAVSELSSPKRYTTPLQINGYRSLKNPDEIDFYLTYMIPIPHSEYKDEHDYGFYLFNKDGDIELKKTGFVSEDFIEEITSEKRPNYQYINTIMTTIKPGDIEYSFETKSKIDEYVSSLRNKMKLPAYSRNKLDMSGVMIASEIHEGTEVLGAMKRKDIRIIPKIGRQFKQNESVFTYYELYNVKKGDDGLTDFEQTLTIRESDPAESGIPILKIIRTISEALAGDPSKISIISSYRTKETDPQVYQQLDLSKYKPGKYDLKITIIDKLSGNKIEREWNFEILN